MIHFEPMWVTFEGQGQNSWSRDKNVYFGAMDVRYEARQADRG